MLCVFILSYECTREWMGLWIQDLATLKAWTAKPQLTWDLSAFGVLSRSHHIMSTLRVSLYHVSIEGGASKLRGSTVCLESCRVGGWVWVWCMIVWEFQLKGHFDLLRLSAATHSHALQVVHCTGRTVLPMPHAPCYYAVLHCTWSQ